MHLQSYKLSPGCGPRTLVVHPRLPMLYLSCELSNEIYALEIGPGGALSLKYRYLSSHLSAGPSGIENFASEVLIHPNGEVLYVANRGPNTITEYRIHPESGQLSLNQEISSQWHWPRSISLSKSGQFLFCCNRLSHRISLFRLGEQGSIQELEATIHAQYPSCVVEL